MRRRRDPFALGIEVAAAARELRVARPDIPDSLAIPAAGGDHLGSQLSRRRLGLGLASVIVGLGLLVSRTGYLQMVQGERLRAVAEGNRVRILEVPAARGKIFDRQGRPLVRHDPNFRLMVTPVDLPRDPGEHQRLVAAIALLIGQAASAIEQQLDALDVRSYQPTLIADQLSHEQAIQLEILGRQFNGVRLSVATVRQYALEPGSSLPHVLGYLGRISPEELASAEAAGYAPSDAVGRSGIELTLEHELSGRKGLEQIEVDATGKKIDIIAAEPATPGNDIRLTIDSELQQQLERALADELARRGLRRGAAVALDPENGEVLALVSLPSFDNNLFARGIDSATLAGLTNDTDRPLFNRAVQGTYPPGSTIKPVIGAAALQEGVVTDRTTFLSTGGLRVNQWFFPDWRSGGHGPTNLTYALADSVNTYFYYVGGGYRDVSGLGVDRMTTYLRAVGVGQALGIELAGEAAGLVPNPEWKLAATGQPWYIGDTYHLAIGQGDLLVTPLQVAAYTSVVANGGTLYRPHVVWEIMPSGSTPGRRLPVDIIRRDIFAADNLAVVRRGLRQAVTAGSARSLAGLPIPVAGKTGTAQWSSTHDHHAWFTGYVPANDPRLVVTILVEEGGEGSAVAVPVAAEFLRWWTENRR